MTTLLELPPRLKSATLAAAYFHLYYIAREDVDYIMDTFPIVKCKNEAAHGEYRTKRVILEIYDEMQRAMETGSPTRPGSIRRRGIRGWGIPPNHSADSGEIIADEYN